MRLGGEAGREGTLGMGSGFPQERDGVGEGGKGYRRHRVEGSRVLGAGGMAWGEGWERAWEYTTAHPHAHCACPAEKEADVYVPLWFEKRLDPLTGETACMYKGGYWEAKERQDWHMCPNIF